TTQTSSGPVPHTPNRVASLAPASRTSNPEPRQRSTSPASPTVQISLPSLGPHTHQSVRRRRVVSVFQPPPDPRRTTVSSATAPTGPPTSQVSAPLVQPARTGRVSWVWSKSGFQPGGQSPDAQPASNAARASRRNQLPPQLEPST